MQLSVPNRTASKNHSFDSTPGSVSEWISALPMANLGETTRLLFEALCDLNHQDIPTAQRFKVLELMNEPVQYVTAHMKKHFVAQPLPLPPRSLKIAHLAREITHALATGYKVLVMEQIAGVGRRDKKLLTVAIHRSIKHLSNVLLKSYQVYEPCPESVWLELHSLYRYAESNGLHKTRVSDERNSEHVSSTIADAYKQILLLALACPYRLRHKEVETVYTAIRQWAPLCELSPVETARGALFTVNFDSDQPPGYLVLRDTNENQYTCRALSTRRLAEHMLKALRQKDGASAATAKQGLSTSTLRRLMLAWGVMPKRRFSRKRDHAQVVVAMGLSAIHYFVSGEAAFNDTAAVDNHCRTELGASPGPVFQQPARFRAKTIQEDIGKQPDVWEMEYTLEGQPAPTSTEVAVARAAAGIQIDTSHVAQNWKMVNVSAGGYCLLWDNPETTRAQVGELLGLREDSDPDTFHWRLGVIRWLKFVDKRGLELGVQMLSPGAVGIAARMDKRGRAKEEDYTRGLLLPEVASIQQQATLLLPAPPFAIGNTAIVNCHGKDVRVRLTKLLENTGSFAQFQFESLGEIATPKPPPGNRKPKPRDFDDVWELL